MAMDKKTLMHVRQLSDDIQREYGIDIAFLDPELQLKRSERSLNYREWDMQKKNLSWKDQIRADMLAARHISETREEFIAAMERSTPDSILWWNKQHTKKIWDRTLGDCYAIDRLMTVEDPIDPVITEDERRNVRKQTRFISVSRYSWNGRRRSDLELLIRKAISIVQKVKAFYEKSGITFDYRPAQKLSSLQEALDVLREMDIGTEDDLHERMHDTGSKLSHVKSEIHTHEAQRSYYAEVEKILHEYDTAKALFDSVRYWKHPHDNLHLSSFTPEEIRQCRADISPMSPGQKRELFLVMKKHPELRLENAAKGYANISSVDAGNVLRYFQGKCDRPNILIDATESFFRDRNESLTDLATTEKFRAAQTNAFQKEIADETPRKQAVLTQLRNRTNALLSLGVDPAKLDETQKEIDAFNNRYESLCLEKTALSGEYRQLVRLQQQIRKNLEAIGYGF